MASEINPHTERYKEMSDRHQRAVIATEEKGKIWVKACYYQGSYQGGPS